MVESGADGGMYRDPSQAEAVESNEAGDNDQNNAKPKPDRPRFNVEDQDATVPHILEIKT